MKIHRSFLFFAALIISSLACGIETPADKSFPTRVAVIQTAAPLYATPENWQTVPAGCVNSLTEVMATEGKAGSRASGVLIFAQSGLSSSGEYGFMYTIMTVNHFKDNIPLKMGSPIEIRVSQGDKLIQTIFYTVTNQVQIIDDSNTPIDVALISVYGKNPATPVNGPGPTPILLDHITSGMNILPDQSIFYHILGYPGGVNSPQFVISRVVDDYEYYGYKMLVTESYKDEFSTTSRGSSGGPLCNNDGYIVGLSTHVNDNYKQSLITPLPNSIRQQIDAFLAESSRTFKLIGYNISP